MIDDEICEHCEELDSRHRVAKVEAACLKLRLGEEEAEFEALMVRTKEAERDRDTYARRLSEAERLLAAWYGDRKGIDPFAPKHVWETRAFLQGGADEGRFR